MPTSSAGSTAARARRLEDANGFNYGLGIAPWARVGVTAIFGPGRRKRHDVGEHRLRAGRSHLEQLLGLHRHGARAATTATRRLTIESCATRRPAPRAINS